MEVFGLGAELADGICLAVLSDVAVHEVLVGSVLVAFAHTAAAVDTPLPSKVGLGIVCLTVCQASLSYLIHLELAVCRFAVESLYHLLDCPDSLGRSPPGLQRLGVGYLMLHASLMVKRVRLRIRGG